MSNDFYVYKFGGFTVDEKEKKLFCKGERVALQPRAFQVLLLLVKHAGEIVSNEEILQKVWQGTFVNESNVNIQINAIRNALGQTNDNIFIKTEEKGFRFTVEVHRTIKTAQTLVKDVIEDESNNSVFQESEPENFTKTGDSQNRTNFGFNNWFAAVAVALIALIFCYFGGAFSMNALAGNYQFAFICLNSFAYGALASITLVLETAYEFEKYKRNVARLAPFVFLTNAAGMYAGLNRAAGFLPERADYAFFSGLLFLFIGTSLSCFLAYFILPNVPITKANEKTQPASFAFLKNIGFYFFPFYLSFGLFLFCLTYSSAENYRNKSLALVFLFVWAFAALLSWLSINIFNSNLKTIEDGNAYKGHGIFVLTSYLRLLFCFLPTLLNIVIYFFSIK